MWGKGMAGAGPGCVPHVYRPTSQVGEPVRALPRHPRRALCHAGRLPGTRLRGDGHSRSSGQGCLRREGASEAAPEAVGWAFGGGCQSGWAPLLSVTKIPLRLVLATRETVAGHRLDALEGGEGGTAPPSNATLQELSTP